MPMASDFQIQAKKIIAKLQCNLQNGQIILKIIALWQVNF